MEPDFRGELFGEIKAQTHTDLKVGRSLTESRYL